MTAEDDALAPQPQMFGQLLDAVSAITGVPAFYGPPISFVLGPWLLIVLLLIGPAALLITFVLLAIITAGVLVALVGLVASPYILVRHLRARRRRVISARGPADTAPVVSEPVPHPGRLPRLPTPSAGALSARASTVSTQGSHPIPLRR